MKLAELQNKLISVARANVPGDHVPYAFEKRVTALLKSRVAADSLNLWVRGLWRAAVSCVAITLLLGAWAFFNPAAANTGTEDFSQSFENTLLASVELSQNDQAQ
jgi:hypothetical protein